MKEKLFIAFLHTAELAIAVLFGFVLMRLFNINNVDAGLIISALVAFFLKYIREVSYDWVNGDPIIPQK